MALVYNEWLDRDWKIMRASFVHIPVLPLHTHKFSALVCHTTHTPYLALPALPHTHHPHASFLLTFPLLLLLLPLPFLSCLPLPATHTHTPPIHTSTSLLPFVYLFAYTHTHLPFTHHTYMHFHLLCTHLLPHLSCLPATPHTPASSLFLPSLPFLHTHLLPATLFTFLFLFSLHVLFIFSSFSCHLSFYLCPMRVLARLRCARARRARCCWRGARASLRTTRARAARNICAAPQHLSCAPAHAHINACWRAPTRARAPHGTRRLPLRAAAPPPLRCVRTRAHCALLLRAALLPGPAAPRISCDIVISLSHFCRACMRRARLIRCCCALQRVCLFAFAGWFACRALLRAFCGALYVLRFTRTRDARARARTSLIGRIISVSFINIASFLPVACAFRVDRVTSHRASPHRALFAYITHRAHTRAYQRAPFFMRGARTHACHAQRGAAAFMPRDIWRKENLLLLHTVIFTAAVPLHCCYGSWTDGRDQSLRARIHRRAHATRGYLC